MSQSSPIAQLSLTGLTFYWGATPPTPRLSAKPKGAPNHAPASLQNQPSTGAGVGFHVADTDIFAGDFLLLSGPSGAGKSSFLRLLVRFEAPSSGAISYNGLDICLIPPIVLRRSIALLPQSPIMGGQTLRQALLLPFCFRANSSEGNPLPDDASLSALLHKLELGNQSLDTVATDLSLGQQQRVALARILLLSPHVLLVDEPTSALDAESRRCVEHCLEELNASGTTIMMITHTDYRPPHSPRPVRRLVLDKGLLHEQP